MAGNPDDAGAQPGRDGDADRLAPHGPDDVDDAGGARRARADLLDATGNVPGRRDAQLVPGAPAARRRHRLRQPVAEPVERRLRRRPPGDDAVGAATTSRSPARRSCQTGELFARQNLLATGQRAARRARPSTSPTSPCRSSTSSARRTTSCRRRRVGLLIDARRLRRRRGAAPAGRATSA